MISIGGYFAIYLTKDYISVAISWVSTIISYVAAHLTIISVISITYVYISRKSLVEHKLSASKLGKTLLIAMGVAIVLYLIIPLVATLLSMIYSYLYPWITSAGSVISVLLTAALIYLYSKQESVLARQTKIQSEQNKILKRQTKWTEAEKTPWLVVDKWGISDDNRVYFDLQNFGGTAIKNLCVIIHISPKEWDEDDPMLTPLPASIPKTPLTNNGGQSMIGPGSNEPIRYYADGQVSFADPSESGEDMWKKSSFQKFLLEADNSSIYAYRTWTTLVYDDINGDDHTDHLSTIDFDLREVEEFKDIFKEGEIVEGSINIYQRTPQPPETYH